jgi:hypothetical protein
VQEAFLYACGYGANRVIEFLLGRLDLAGHTGDGQSGAHYVVIFGRPDTLKLLLKQSVPLEAKNMYGGTVLGQTLWSAAHGGDPELYSQIIETLIAAGAKIPERQRAGKFENKCVVRTLRQACRTEVVVVWRRARGQAPFWFGERFRRGQG